MFLHQRARIDHLSVRIGRNHGSYFSGTTDLKTIRFCSSFIKGDAVRMSSAVPKRMSSITSRSVNELEEVVRTSCPTASMPSISFGRSETIPYAACPAYFLPNQSLSSPSIISQHSQFL